MADEQERWLNLAEVACAHGEIDDARIVAWQAGQPVVRRAFRAGVQRWAARFAEVAGRRVALSMDDSFEFACALFGAWHAGKVVCLPGDTQPQTLARLMPEMDACAGQLPRAMAAPAPEGVPAWPAMAPLPPQQTRLVVYTSGSSGEPMAIEKSLSQLEAEVGALQAAFGALIKTPGGGSAVAVVQATVSHQHIYGLLFLILWPLAAGRSFVAERLAYPEDLAARLKIHAASVWVTSPAHLKRLPETLGWQEARQSLRGVFSSGGPLPFEAARACSHLLGHAPIEVFGSSETGGIAWRQRSASEDEGAWSALPGVEWRVEGASADQPGRLAVRSAHLSDSQAWYTTADCIRPVLTQAKGSPPSFIHLGRADRIVKIEEKRVSIAALDALLARCEALTQARVLVLDEAGQARLAVVAVPSDAGQALLRQGGKRLLNARLRECLLQGVERVVLPRRFRYVSALPMDPQGKTSRDRLAALFRPLMPPVVWHEREALHANLEIDVNGDLMAFDGHFPQGAILPGVVQLDWAVQLAQSHFGSAIPPCFVRVDALKFQRPVVPGMRIELSLQWRPGTQVLAFLFRSDAQTVHSSGNVVFAAAQGPDHA